MRKKLIEKNFPSTLSKIYFMFKLSLKDFDFALEEFGNILFCKRYPKESLHLFYLPQRVEVVISYLFLVLYQ